MKLHPLPALPTPPVLPVPVTPAKRSTALTRPYATGDRRGTAGAVAPESSTRTARPATTLRATNSATGGTTIDVNAPYVPGSLVDIIA
jgi:hypothetical protein